MSHYNLPKIATRIILLIIFIVIFASATFAAKAKTYYNHKGKYSITVGDNWNNIPAIVEMSNVDFVFIHAGSDSVTKYPYFYVDTDLRKTDVNTPYSEMSDTLNEYVESIISNGPEYEGVKSCRRVLADYSAENKIWTVGLRVDFDDSKKVPEYQYIVIFYGLDRIVTFDLYCNADKLEPYISDFKKIVNSFKFDAEIDYLPPVADPSLTEFRIGFYIVILISLTLVMALVIGILLFIRKRKSKQVA